MVCDQDLPDKIIGILFVSLITACAGILIFAALTAMSLNSADATKWHDGTMFVSIDHPLVNETATFWVSGYNNNYTENIQTIQPIVLGDTAFFFYPHTLTNGEYIFYNVTYYEPVSHDEGRYIANYPAENTYQKYVWAKPILALHNTTQTMSQTIIELENKIETLQDKLGKQGKRIQKLETLLFN